MHSWKFWDWVAYAGLFIAAIVLAADAGLKSSPTVAIAIPQWINHPLWSFIPLILLIISTGIFLANAITIRFTRSTGSSERNPRITYSTPTVPSRKPDRELVNVLPEYLMGLVADKITTEADRLTGPYMGKWISLSGHIDDVSCSKYSGHIDTARDKEFRHFEFYFEPSWNDKLMVLHKGQFVNVVGKIRSVSRGRIVLEECELTS